MVVLLVVVFVLQVELCSWGDSSDLCCGTCRGMSVHGHGGLGSDDCLSKPAGCGCSHCTVYEPVVSLQNAEPLTTVSVYMYMW